MKNEFYVYRFINKDEKIVYVGKTIDLKTRFRQHEHLTDDIIKIEYIECASEADMTWKEIYYINLYKNKDTTNSSCLCNDNVTVYDFGDIWFEYKLKLNGQYEIRYHNDDKESFHYYNKNAEIINPDNIYTYIKYKKGLNPMKLYVVSFETFISTEYYSGGYHFTKNENELLYNSTYTIAEAALYNNKGYAKEVAKLLNKNYELLYNVKLNYDGCYIARSFDSCITTDVNPIIREDFKDKIEEIEKTKKCMPGLYIIPENFENGIPDKDYMKFLKNMTSC